MKIERSKNASRNVVFGFLQTIYSQIVPFAMRTIMIYVMGIEYLGLNSLFASVLSVLNLAELGVGSAMVFSMYKPIAEDDKVTICALMKLYRTYYRIIGLVIAVVGGALTPFIPKLINGTVPDGINVYVLYLINLATTVLTYWLFAYKNCLLGAHQRGDISSKIGIVISTITYGLQIVVLFATHNYYIYIIVAFAMGAVNNVVTAIIVDKIFPDYHAIGKLPKDQVEEINKKVRDLFTAKLGTVVVNSVDTIVISAFLGLKVLAVYQNYFYICNAVFGFITIIFGACTAGIGNSIITETEEKNFNDLKKFTLMISWIGGFSCCCFACLYQPFMELWVGKDNMLGYSYVILFCVYFYLRIINQLFCTYKDAAGIWHEDRYRPLITAIANLGMNLIMVQFWGLYGILLSTIISTMIIGTPWLMKNLFTVIFHNNPKKYIIKILVYLFVAIIDVAICVGISRFLTFDSLILTMIARLIVCAIVPNLSFFIIFRKSNEFIGLLEIVNSLTKGKIKFISRGKEL